MISRGCPVLMTCSLKPLASLRECLGRDLAVAHIELEKQLVVFLKSDIEVMYIDKQADFLVNGPQHFVGIQVRADDLAYLREELIFARAAPRLLHRNMAFEREPYLHRDSQQQADV